MQLHFSIVHSWFKWSPFIMFYLNRASIVPSRNWENSSQCKMKVGKFGSSLSLSISLSIYPSIHPSIHLSIYLSISHSLTLSLSLLFSYNLISLHLHTYSTTVAKCGRSQTDQCYEPVSNGTLDVDLHLWCALLQSLQWSIRGIMFFFTLPLFSEAKVIIFG